jgi:hypothetical protein
VAVERVTAAVVTAGGAGTGREYLVEVVIIRYQQVEKLEYLGSQRPVCQFPSRLRG